MTDLQPTNMTDIQSSPEKSRPSLILPVHTQNNTAPFFEFAFSLNHSKYSHQYLFPQKKAI